MVLAPGIAITLKHLDAGGSLVAINGPEGCSFFCDVCVYIVACQAHPTLVKQV